MAAWDRIKCKEKQYKILTFPNICLKVSSLVNSPADLDNDFLPLGDEIASSVPGTGISLTLYEYEYCNDDYKRTAVKFIQFQNIHN